MTSLFINNFRNISGAHTLPMDKITLLAGPNASGKTSVAMATAAALTGSTQPMGIKKSSAHMLVRDGAKRGATVILSGPSGSTRMDWPEAKSEIQGTPLKASPVAAGLVRLSAIAKEADRATMMGPYIRAEPSEKDLQDALEALNLSGYLQALWREINVRGWDGVLSTTKTKNTGMKGQWKQATGGETYGSDKAAKWVPEGWEDDLHNHENEALLVRECASAKTHHERAIGNKAVDADLLLRLRTEASTPREDIASLEEKIKEAERAYEEARKARNILPSTQSSGFYECPHPACKGPIDIECNLRGNGERKHLLSVVEELSKEETKKRRLDIAGADGRLSNKWGALVRAREVRMQAVAKNGEIEGAQKQLKRMDETKTGSAEMVDAARDKLDRAKARLACWRQWQEASRLTAKISENQSIIDILAPQGLRSRVLNAALAQTNDDLVRLCNVAGWGSVRIGEGLTLSFNDRPYALLSVSEQFRVDVTIQVYLAMKDKSEMLVLDGTDVLDKEGRGGMLRLLVHAKIPSLMCMTITNPAKQPPPDFAVMGIGRTYWISGGVVSEFDTRKKAA